MLPPAAVPRPADPYEILFHLETTLLSQCSTIQTTGGVSGVLIWLRQEAERETMVAFQVSQATACQLVDSALQDDRRSPTIVLQELVLCHRFLNTVDESPEEAHQRTLLSMSEIGQSL